MSKVSEISRQYHAALSMSQEQYEHSNGTPSKRDEISRTMALSSSVRLRSSLIQKHYPSLTKNIATTRTDGSRLG